MSFFTSTEFLICCLVMAAAIVAYLCVPSKRGAAREFTVRGDLDCSSDTVPEVRVDCLDNGTVLLTRSGLTGLTDTDSLSIAVTIIGFDITVEERYTPGRTAGDPVNRASFTIDCLGHERYHVRYNSSWTSTAASIPLNNRPGYNSTRRLTH